MAFTVDPNFDRLVWGMNIFARDAESRSMELLRSRQLDAYIKSSDAETAAYGLGYSALLEIIHAKIAANRGELLAARLFFQRALSSASVAKFTTNQTSGHIVDNCKLDIGILEYLAGNLGQATAILGDLLDRVLPQAPFYLGRMLIEIGKAPQGLALLAQADLVGLPSFDLIREEIKKTVQRGATFHKAVLISPIDLCQFPY